MELYQTMWPGEVEEEEEENADCLFESVHTPTEGSVVTKEEDATPSPPLFTQSPSFLASAAGHRQQRCEGRGADCEHEEAPDEPLLWAIECILDRMKNDWSPPAAATICYLTQLATQQSTRLGEGAVQSSMEEHRWNRQTADELVERLRLYSVIQMMMCQHPDAWDYEACRTFQSLLQSPTLAPLRKTGMGLLHSARKLMMLAPLRSEPTDWVMLGKRLVADQALDPPDNQQEAIGDVRELRAELERLHHKKSSSRVTIAALLRRHSLEEYRVQISHFMNRARGHFPSTHLDRVVGAARPSVDDRKESSKGIEKKAEEDEQNAEEELENDEEVETYWQDSPDIEFEKDEDEAINEDEVEEHNSEGDEHSAKKQKIDTDQASDTRAEWIRRLPKNKHRYDRAIVTTGNRRPRRRWTDEETCNLLEGAKRFGVGNWKAILQHYDFPGRTAVDLKDKYRNLEREQDRHATRPRVSSLALAPPATRPADPRPRTSSTNTSLDDDIED